MNPLIANLLSDNPAPGGIALGVWTVLTHSLLLGIALAGIVRLTLAAVSSINAATRYAIWFAALIGIAVLPAALVLRDLAPALNIEASAAEPREPRAPAQAVAARSVALSVPDKAPVLSHTPLPADSVGEPGLKVPLAADDAEGFLGVIAFASVLLLLRLLVSYVRIRLLYRRSAPPPPELAARFEQWLALCPPGRAVHLRMSSRASGPMAIGFLRPTVLIPDSLLLSASPEELDRFALHEIAHLRRYDDWSNLAQRIIQSLFFFHPAVHYICSRLEFEREVACDDWVLTLGATEPKPYAESLARVLEGMPRRHRSGLILATGAAFRKRQIFRRIELLLDRTRNAAPRISPMALVVAVLCVCGAFSQLLQTSFLVGFEDRLDSRSHWNMNGRRIELHKRGEVEFSDDGRWIKALSPDGVLLLREGGFLSANVRQLEVRPSEGGDLRFRYRLNGQDQAFDEQARAWATGIIQFAVREGMDAEQRADRILATRGVPGLLREVEVMTSDHARQIYLQRVLRSNDASADDIRRALSRAGRLNGDHQKLELLKETTVRAAATPDLRGAWFDVLQSMHGSHEQREALRELIQDFGASPQPEAFLAQVGRALESIPADHEKSEVLRMRPLLGLMAENGTAARPLLRAAASINGSHEKAEVFSAMVSETPLAPALLQELVQSVASSIPGSHERAEALRRLMQQQPDWKEQPGVRAAVFAAISGIPDDGARASLLAENTQSSAGPDAAAAGDVIEAVRKLHSDQEKRRVLESMLKRGDSPEVARQVAAVAGSINGDDEKAAVLTAVLQRYPGDAEVRKEVRQAARKIHSDAEYRRIATLLLREPSE